MNPTKKDGIGREERKGSIHKRRQGWGRKER
jgi:hypothetical protein